MFRTTMTHIQLLPEILINQIAAGEVVERPASVIKELVENSLDAGAKRIVVEVNDVREDLIRITDDGCGMDKDDAVLSVERHATSKIRTAQDLINIRTLGFRGEALASISSVSHMTLQTKKHGAHEGTLVILDGGKITKVSSIGAPEGTQIEVKHLFFNTPARKKYLKNVTTEYHHVITVLTGLALSYPHVGFRLIHNDGVTFDVPPADDDLMRIRALLGKSITDELIPVFYGHSAMLLKGYIGKPSIARGNRNLQYLFVNTREVKSQVLSYAVKQSYYSLLPKEKYPVFVLYFTIDPTIVDVNVHPRKLEVRFTNEKEIFSAVTRACQKALEDYILAPKIGGLVHGYSTDRAAQAPLTLRDVPLSINLSSSDLQSVASHFSGPHAFTPRVTAPVTSPPNTNEENVSESLAFTGMPGDTLSTEMTLRKDASADENISQELSGGGNSFKNLSSVSNERETSFQKRETQEEIVPLAQLDNSYILCQQGASLLIVDQHAAHERIRYKEIVEQFESRKKATQLMLITLSL